MQSALFNKGCLLILNVNRNAAAIAASRQLNPDPNRKASRKYYTACVICLFLNLVAAAENVDRNADIINAQKRAKRMAEKIFTEINGVLATISLENFTDLVARVIILDTEEIEDIQERILLLKEHAAKASSCAAFIVERCAVVHELVGDLGNFRHRSQIAQDTANSFVLCVNNIWDEVIIGNLEENELQFSQLNWGQQGLIQV